MQHPAGLVQGVRGAPAPVVEFLLDTPSALIQGVAGQVYDVEGVHDRPCAGELFGGSALEPGESIHRDDLDALAPGVGLGGQPGFEDPLGSAGTMSKSREGPRRSRTGVKSKTTVTYLSPYGVWRHTCSSTPMTRTPSHRAGSLISRRAPSVRTAVLVALPGHAQGLGDARHRHMMNDHARQ